MFSRCLFVRLSVCHKTCERDKNGPIWMQTVTGHPRATAVTFLGQEVKVIRRRIDLKSWHHS